MTLCRSESVEQGAAAAALQLARRGHPVFPCRPRSKRPATLKGLHDATRDPGLIRAWFEESPDANVAVRTGDGLLVLDVDGDAGRASLERLTQEYGNLPTTVSLRTGSGTGRHWWFRTTGPVRNSAGKLGPGLDIRGDGGYALVPPSVTTGPYRWVAWAAEGAIQPAPRWLLERLAERPAAGRRTSPREWIRMLDRIDEGQRNDSLARLTGHLLARDVDDHVAARLVLAVNSTACKPPLPQDEVIGIVESILRRHLRRGKVTA